MNLKKISDLLASPRLYVLAMKIRPFTGRYLFLTLCVMLLVLYAAYTRHVIDEVQDNFVAVTETYAELIRAAISEKMDASDINLIFEQIIRRSSNPVIITDPDWNPVLWKNIQIGNIFVSRVLAVDDTSEWARKILNRKVTSFRSEYEPKPLVLPESQQRIGYLVFGRNYLVEGLKWIPVFGLTALAAFLAVVYLAFHAVRVTERSNLWVGLAKETAHQLGTPISSLMGWVEYLRTTADGEVGEVDPGVFLKQASTICSDMENDLTRLRKITNRFSQIGSVPKLVSQDLNAILDEAREYLSVRMPMLRRRIEIRTHLGILPPVELNRDLLEWVFENLMKNSIDAIHNDHGLIEVSTEYIKVDNIVRILHTDNGAGIAWDHQKRIFSPGYTTKKRGWGLGLTLAKRIVDEYHNGKITVTWSQRDKGTTFCIDLPVLQKNRIRKERIS